MALHRALHSRLHTRGRPGLHHTPYGLSQAVDFVTSPRLASGLTLSRSAGSVYYFNGSGVLTATGDNVAAFTSNGLFIEGQATNLIAAANYRDFSTWASTGVTMKATTPTGIDGTTLAVSLNEIMEDTGNTNHMKSITFTAATAAKQSLMVAVKRGTGTRHARLRVGNATDGIYGDVSVNLDTLAEIGTTVADYWTAYVKGVYTIIELVDTNVTTGTQTIYLNMMNGSLINYTGDGASTLIFDWAQVVTNTATSGVAQSHVQGAATRYTSFISRPWIGATNNFWVYLDLYPKFNYNLALTPGFMRIFSIYTSASNLLNAYLQGNTGAVSFSHTIGGSSTTSGQSAVMAFSRGDRLRVLLTMDSVNGGRLRVNFAGTAYTINLTGAASKSGIPAFSSGTNLYLCNYDIATDRALPAELASYKVGTGILTTAQMSEMVGV